MSRVNPHQSILCSGLFIAMFANCSGSYITDVEPQTPKETDTNTYTEPDETDTGTYSYTDTDTTDTDLVDPIAVDDEAEVDEGDAVEVDLVANDTDPDGDLDPSTVSIIVGPQYGTLTVNPSGLALYTHGGTEEVEDTFEYKVGDALGNVSNSAIVTFTINGINDPPEAIEDQFYVDEGDNAILDLAANDIDVDDGLDLTSIDITRSPYHGYLTTNADGTVTYHHDGGENPFDSFYYTIADLSGEVSNEAFVDVDLVDTNDPPTANDDTKTVDKGMVGVFDLARNDQDPDDGVELDSIVIVTQPSYGAVTVNADGTVDYAHDDSPNYADVFTYTIEDRAGALSNVATVNVEVL